MIVKPKQNPTCPLCSLGWMETKLIRNELWRRCMSCGYMEKVSKTQKDPVGDK